MSRKVIQIDTALTDKLVLVVALCDDGTMWSRDNRTDWKQLPPVPQPVQVKDSLEELKVEVAK